MTAPLFTLEDVRKRYCGPGESAGFEIAIGRLVIESERRLVVAAPSGAGKSTLLYVLMFALQPSGARQFRFAPPDGRSHDIAESWRVRNDRVLSDLRKRYMGIVSQAGHLLPCLTVRRNIAMPRRLLALEDDDTVDTLAERLGIRHLLDRRPTTLSFGERQRVAIARALAHRPRVVLADEPTASLDRHSASAALELLCELVEKARATLVVASHDPEVVEQRGLQRINHQFSFDAGAGVARADYWLD